MNRPEKRLKTQITMSVVTLLTIMAIIGTTYTTRVYAQSPHEAEVVQQIEEQDNSQDTQSQPQPEDFMLNVVSIHKRSYHAY